MKITLNQENEKKEPPIFLSESGPNFGLNKQPVGALTATFFCALHQNRSYGNQNLTQKVSATYHW